MRRTSSLAAAVVLASVLGAVTAGPAWSPLERPPEPPRDDSDGWASPAERFDGPRTGQAVGSPVPRRKPAPAVESPPLDPIPDGLAWLTAAQREDGSFGGSDADTGLALLAFLATGETHKHGRHKRTVRRGLDWLKKAAGADRHPIAVLALCEAYALTASPLFRDAAADGARGILARGLPDDGDAFWAMLAAKSARQARLPVPDGFAADVERWLDRASGGTRGWTMTFTGRLPPDTPEAQAAAALAVRRICLPEAPEVPGQPALVEEALRDDGAGRDAALLYFGTLAAWQKGGETWRSWRDPARRLVLDRQRKTGRERGSWDPDRRAGPTLGRVGTTALSVMTLSVWCRYERIVGSVDPRER